MHTIKSSKLNSKHTRETSSPVNVHLLLEIVTGGLQQKLKLKTTPDYKHESLHELNGRALIQYTDNIHQLHPLEYHMKTSAL